VRAHALLGGFAPAQVSVAETLGRSGPGPDQSRAGPSLVGQSVSGSLALPSLGVSTSVLTSRIADVVRPLQESLQQMVNGLFHLWSEVARFGVGLARALARAAIFAAMRARDAALHGRVDEVDVFIEDWLDQGRLPGAVTPWSWCCSTASGSQPTLRSVVAQSWADQAPNRQCDGEEHRLRLAPRGSDRPQPDPDAG
jgi:hypothetical protein